MSGFGGNWWVVSQLDVLLVARGEWAPMYTHIYQGDLFQGVATVGQRAT